MEPIRLLLVDNDAETGTAYERLFSVFIDKEDFYEFEYKHVIGNWTQIPNVLDQVRSIASEFRPHVSLVDLCMFGEPAGDTSTDEEHIATGIAVCRYLQSQGTRTIVLSGQLNIQLTSRLKAEGVNDWVVKNADFKSVKLPMLKEQARKACAAARSFQVVWPLATVPVALTKHERLSKYSKLQVSVFADLLAKLFPEDNEIHLYGIGNQPIQKAENVIRRAPVFRLSRQGGKSGIVKFAPREQIDAEYSRYEKYIEGVLGPGYHATYKRPVHFYEVGAISASFVGYEHRTLPDFRQHYKAEGLSNEEVVKPLKHFFENVWKKHYESAVTLTKGSFYNNYVQCYPKFSKRLELLLEGDAEQEHMAFDFIPETLPNPVRFVDINANQAQPANAKLSITHGDLHCLNLLVDRNMAAFIIDFEFTSEGPRLRDFARFELDVYVRLVADETHDEYVLLHALVRHMLTQADPKHIPASSDVIASSPALSKAYAVISQLRQSMNEVTHYTDMSEYYWTLLLETVYRAGRAKERAILTEESRRSIQGAVSNDEVDPDDRLKTCMLIGGLVASRLSN